MFRKPLAQHDAPHHRDPERHDQQGQLLSRGRRGGGSHYTLDADNTSNVDLEAFTLSDPLPENFALTSIRLPHAQQCPGVHRLSQIPAERHRDHRIRLAGGAFPVGHHHAERECTGPSRRRVCQLPAVPVRQRGLQFQHPDGGRLEWHADLPRGHRQAIANGSSVCNTAYLEATYLGSPAWSPAKTSTDCVAVVGPPVRPTVAKSILSGASTAPGGVTVWQVEVSNPPGSGVVQPANPKGLELLPAGVDYVAGSLTRITSGSSTVPGRRDRPSRRSRTTTAAGGRWFVGPTRIASPSTPGRRCSSRPGCGGDGRQHPRELRPGLGGPRRPVGTGDLSRARHRHRRPLRRRQHRRPDRAAWHGGEPHHHLQRLARFHKQVKGKSDAQWSQYPASAEPVPGARQTTSWWSRTADVLLREHHPHRHPARNRRSGSGHARTPGHRVDALPYHSFAPSGVIVHYSTASNPQRDDLGHPDPFPAWFQRAELVRGSPGGHHHGPIAADRLPEHGAGGGGDQLD